MPDIRDYRRRGPSVFDRLGIGARSDASGWLLGLLRGSKTHDWASIATGAQATTTVTVTGAALGDICLARMSISGGGLKFGCDITATNTATVTATNDTGGAVDLASGTLIVSVIKDELTSA